MPTIHLSPAVLCIIGSVFLCLLSLLSRLLTIQNAIDTPIRKTYYPIAQFHIAVGLPWSLSCLLVSILDSLGCWAEVSMMDTS
jgi:hypothetical protein